MPCKTILREGLAALAIDLDDHSIALLCRYYTELGKWSKKMNLVARGDERTILETHFLDSLTMLPLLRRQAGEKSLLDIGSGAGFPAWRLNARYRHCPLPWPSRARNGSPSSSTSSAPCNCPRSRSGRRGSNQIRPQATVFR